MVATSVMLIVGFLILAIILLLSGNFKKSTLPFPPGPRGLPFIGSLLQFRKQPLKSLLKWQTEYGNIVGLQLGSYRAVLLSDISILKEAFNNMAFNGRPKFIPFVLFSGGSGHGSLQSEGETWDQIRKFTVKNLNDLGFGKKLTEHIVMEGVQEMVQNLLVESASSTPINLRDKVLIPVSRYAWEVLMGETWDSNMSSIMPKALENFHNSIWTHIGSIIWMLPMLANIFPRFSGYVEAEKSANFVHKIISDRLTRDDDLENNNEKDILPTNLVDSFRHTMAKDRDNPMSAFYGSGGAHQMKGTLSNLYITAGGAMSNTLNWAFIYISSHPEVQRKMQSEIDDIVGVSRAVTLDDMQRLPYVCAVMKEVSRLASSSPYSNFQATTSDVEFHGYMIPKGTIIIGNIYGAHNDPRIWDAPEEFRPERFFGEEGKKAPCIIPFSVGLRTCPAQTFVRNLFFLFLVSLCQRFTFEFDTASNPVPNQDQIADDCNPSLFRFAKFYNYKIKERC